MAAARVSRFPVIIVNRTGKRPPFHQDHMEMAGGARELAAAAGQESFVELTLHGVAVTFTGIVHPTYPPGAGARGGRRGSAGSEEWIFDGATLQWIGENYFAHGKPNGREAILVRAFVNRLGQVPART